MVNLFEKMGGENFFYSEFVPIFPPPETFFLMRICLNFFTPIFTENLSEFFSPHSETFFSRQFIYFFLGGGVMKGIKSTTNQSDLVGDTFRSFLPKFIWSRFMKDPGARGKNSRQK